MARMNFGVGINLYTDKFKKGAKNVQTSLAKMKSSILAMSAAFTAGTLSMGAFIKGAQQTVRDLAKAQQVLKNVTGDTNAYGESISYLNGISKKYNAEIINLTNNYSKFLASSKGANMSVKETRNIFEAVTQASTFFNLSADETNGVMLALNQMMSKGKIQAEELRGQLGERLPGALSTMAKSLGVTTKELDKMMKDGKLIAKDVLPLFAQQLKIETAGFDKNSIEGSINALKNTWTEMWSSPDMQKAFSTLINGLSATLQFLADNIKNIFIASIGVMVGYATNMLNRLTTQFTQTQEAIIRQYDAQLTKIQGKINRSPKAVSVSGLKNSMTQQEADALNKMRDEMNKVAKASTTATEAHNAMFEAMEKHKKGLKLTTLAGRDYYDSLVLIGKESGNVLETLGAQYGSLEALDDALITQRNQVTQTTKKLSKFSAMWNLAGNAMKNIFGNLKNMVVSNLPGIILGGITMVVLKVKEWYNEQKRLNNLLKDSLKEVGNVNAISATLESAKQILSEISKFSKASDEYKKSIKDINKLLGTQYTKEEDIRKEIKKRQNELIKEARLRASTNKITELEGEKLGLKPKQEEYQKLYFENYNKTIRSGLSPENDYLTVFYKKLLDEINNQIKKYDDAIQGLVREYGKDMLSEGGEDKNGGGEPNEEFGKIKDKYLKGIKEINNQFSRDAITVEEFIEEINKLKETTFKAGSAIDNLSKSELDFLNSIKPNRILEEGEEEPRALKQRSEETDKLINELKAFNKAIAEYSQPQKGRNTTFDYKLSKEDKSIVDLEHQLSNVQKQYDIILEGIKGGATGLDDIFQELVNNAETLQDKLDLANINKDIAEMQSNVNKMSYEGLKNMASSLDSMVNAWKRISELNEDTDASGWEKFLSVFNAITQTLDGLIGIFETFNKIGKIIETISAAQAAASALSATQKTTEAGIIVAANTAIASSNSLVAKTGAIASASMVPFPGTIPAMGANVAGATALLASSAITPFADGGIVSGPTKALVGEYAGARNNPEVIAPLNKLKSILGDDNKNGNGVGKVEFVLKGKDLYGSISNYKSVSSKYGK